MTFEEITNNLVKKLNRENHPQNPCDCYRIVRWYDSDLSHKRFALYHEGGRCVDHGWGAIAFTKAYYICKTDEEAYAALIEDYLYKRFSIIIDFDCPEELEIKLAIRGISLG